MKKVHIDTNMFQAAIFDMDGTMIDNMVYHKKAWKEFLTKHNFSLTDDEFNRNIVGKKNDQILEYVFEEKLTSEELRTYGEEKEARYRKLYKPAIQEVEGLSHFINELRNKNLKLAIATTAPFKNRTFGLAALGVADAFNVIVGAEDVQHGKPDPEIYLLTAEKLQVKPRECIAFEDSIAGIQAAKAAGMTVVGMLTSHTKNELVHADYLVENFSMIDIS